MRVLHDSSDIRFRDPFGAIQVGGAVTLALEVWDAPDAVCWLRVWVDGQGEKLVRMNYCAPDESRAFNPDGSSPQTGDAAKGSEAPVRHVVRLDLDEKMIVWYHFVIERKDRTWVRYAAQQGRTCGEGALTSNPSPPSWQISVYQPREISPDWYTNGIVYQVFPDRFARGADWRRRVADSLSVPRSGPARKLVEDWGATPRYEKDGAGRITCWDFFGGTLLGIEERLDYLADLGVTCLYLNPIFEAASNHRYDTADYLRIDPMLGDEDAFRSLCREAAKRGISVILDGVFNHTGCDSRYFNRYGNYSEPGAWQGEDSPYRKWFRFRDDGTYECWWGVEDLPDIEEGDPTYQEFVCGEDGVVRKWLGAGARGWRLDVADELPDEFIEKIRTAQLAERPDGVLIGEVWEDASNKISYGKLRRYLLGDELDAAMNYPLREAVLGFLRGERGAPQVAADLAQLRENYPPEALACSLNMLGSHDRPRLLTMLGPAPDPLTLTEDERASFRFGEKDLALARRRLWLATLLQMTLPGVPCIYYGDEAGLQGFADPYNRGTFPWGAEDAECQAIYRRAISVRVASDAFIHGNFEPFSEGDDVFGFWRSTEGERMCVIANRSEGQGHMLRIPCAGLVFENDLVAGQHAACRLDGCVIWHERGALTLELPPLSAAVLRLRPEGVGEGSLS